MSVSRINYIKKVSLDEWIQLIGMLGIFEKTDAMSHYPHPKGWTYSSRVLSEDLELNSEGVVNMLAIRSKISSVWEKRGIR